MTAPQVPRPSLPLRRWLVLLLAVAFLVPVVTTAVVAFLTFGQGNQDVRRIVADRLFAADANWSDSAWQAETVASFAPWSLDIALSVDGITVFRSVPDPLIGPTGEPRARTIERLGDPARPTRVAEIASPNGLDNAAWGRWGRDRSSADAPWQIPIAGFCALFLTLVGIGWFLGRTVVTPLRHAAAAADRIAEGDLEIALPSSRVREVAQVTTAVTGMSAALRASLRQQTELEQERRFFVAAVAHDLRTPLFALRGSLQGIVQGVADTPEKTARYLSVALDKADALDHLVSDLFAFTRLEYLDQSPVFEPIDLADLLDGLVAALQPQAAAKSLLLTVVPPDAPVSTVIRADPHLLDRAFGNILDNALRHTPPDGRITVTLSATPLHLTVAVADTGTGIPTEDLPHLFSPLFRGESSRNRATGGAGLGLAVTRRIVAAHAGTVTAANRPTGGAQFTVTLPTHPNH